MDFTGERYIPNLGGSIELEHMHRYLVAKKYVAGKIVLDIASGEGYGSKCLAESAADVIGVDIDESIVKHANSKYGCENLKYVHGSCEAIPLADNLVDVVVSFETIEHHAKHEEMMEEIRRVLKPDGLLIISSPDKLEYTDLTGYDNPYHVKELYRDEFEQLLSKFFRNTVIQGQRVVYGSLLQSQCDNTGLTTYFDEQSDVLQQDGIRKAIYLVALASDAEFGPLDTSFYEKPVYMSEIVQNLLKETGELKGQIEHSETALSEFEHAKTALELQYGELQASFDQETHRLMTEKVHLLNEQRKLEQDAEQLNTAKNELDEQLQLIRAQNDELTAKCIKLEQENAWFSADRQLMLNSLSWKLTAWLRLISRKLFGTQ